MVENTPNQDVSADEPRQDDKAHAAAAIKDRPAPPKIQKLPPFKVLLHNDPVNTMEWVVDSIVELTPHKMEMAVQLTLEAHTTGVAVVLVTHKERAELYQDQFASKKLTVTIEPAE